MVSVEPLTSPAIWFVGSSESVSVTVLPDCLYVPLELNVSVETVPLTVDRITVGLVYVPADEMHQFKAAAAGPGNPAGGMTFLCMVPLSRNCGDATPGS